MAKGSGSRAGGGIKSSTVRHNRFEHHGKPGRQIREAGVSQIGSNLGNHSTGSGGKKLPNAVEKVRGKERPAGSPGGVELGNSKAMSAGQGPGAGRTLYGQCGSQQPSTPNAGQDAGPKRDILREYGPDSKRR
jgi:hypothetical protein